MSTEDKSQVTAALRARFERDPSGVLEEIAHDSGLATVEVMDCLPAECHAMTGAEAFEEVMAEVTGWGDITLLVHTRDLILEYKGALPPGRIATGYYNLLSPSLGGHLRIENCASIHFVRRSFMKLDTAAIVFINRQGEPMFKIFVGRNPDRSLKREQVKAFDTLRQRLASLQTD